MRRAVAAIAPLLVACTDLDLETLRFRCAADGDCAEGAVCDPVRRICAAPEAVSDAGQVADAGVVDASADAGTAPDSGPPDPCLPCGARGCVGGRCLAVRDLSLGLEHSCASIEDGTVACWGGNAHGELGLGFAGETRGPRKVEVSDVVTLAAGRYHTCVLDRGGDVRCWGRNLLGETGVRNGGAAVLSPPAAPVLRGVVELAAGKFATTCARGSDVRCWGFRVNGQRWTGEESGAFDASPVVFRGLRAAPASLAVGSFHACAVLESGAPACWGFNENGQLGTGTTASATVARAVDLGARTSSLALGDLHSCARAGGRVKCWGHSWFVLGGTINSTVTWTPQAIGLIEPAAQLAVGRGTTCAVLESGRVACWGVPLGVEGADPAPASFVDGFPSRVRKIALGMDHACAILDTGEVWCWGNNRATQLGVGDVLVSPVPVRVDWTR